MTHAWKQTIEIDEKKAKKLIESQHSITVNKIHLLDSHAESLGLFAWKMK